jgi:unsaturated rhamnogalacturonyl hydrolase
MSTCSFAFRTAGALACLVLLQLPSISRADSDVPRFEGATPGEWAVRMAESEIARRGDALRQGGSPRAGWDYGTALLGAAMVRLSEATWDPRWREWGEGNVASFVESDGSVPAYPPEEYNLDRIAPGRVLLTLFERTKDERFRVAAQALRAQLATQPRTSDGGFWHKLRYPSQMWLDGLYMAGPFYAHYGRLFDDPAAIDDAVHQFVLMDRHAWVAKDQLHRHGWDESREQPWADEATGLSANYWGRAVGWYAMALVDVLDHVPREHPGHERIREILGRVAAGIVRHQDPDTGVWWQVLDQGGREGNYLEGSASSMFVYALARGVNQGHLPRTRYLPAIERGFAGLIRELIGKNADGTIDLLRCCRVAGLGGGRDGSFAYYVGEQIVKNDIKGTGPFIFAGVEAGRALAGPKAMLEPSEDPWELAREIIARVRAPEFPDRDFDITAFGAVAGGEVDATAAIRSAIEACHAAGGGRVVVPEGVFLTGAVHLLSRVNLHLVEGATLRFTADPQKYLPLVHTRWEGVELMNYSPMVYAFEQEDIAITGKGVLDGAATEQTWWRWTRRQPDGSQSWQFPSRGKLFDMGERGVPVAERVFGPGEHLRPNMIQPYLCKNVLIEGVTVRDSPMWHIHPVLCTNVIVRGVSVIGLGPNNDGCNPESCRDVLIEDCLFDTGDDCIAIKSGRNNDGRRIDVPSENIVVRNCVMKEGHGGVVMGSEISGGCRNVFVEDCVMDSPVLDRALRFKSNARRGGVIENVYMRNVEVGRVARAVLEIDLMYEEGSRGPHRPVVRNVEMVNVNSSSSPRALRIAGFPGSLIDDIRVIDCTFRGVEATEMLTGVGSVRLQNVVIEPIPAMRNPPRRSPPAPAPTSPTR